MIFDKRKYQILTRLCQQELYYELYHDVFVFHHVFKTVRN